jgi:hypothetical protein
MSMSGPETYGAGTSNYEDNIISDCFGESVRLSNQLMNFTLKVVKPQIL